MSVKENGDLIISSTDTGKVRIIVSKPYWDEIKLEFTAEEAMKITSDILNAIVLVKGLRK